jgi:hypothetical protein
LYTFATVEKNPPTAGALSSASNPVTPTKQVDTMSKTSPPSIKRRRRQPDAPKHPVYVIRRDIYRLRRAMEEHCDPKHNAKVLPTLKYHMQRPAIPPPIFRHVWLYPSCGVWICVIQRYFNSRRLGFPDAEPTPVSSDEDDDAVLHTAMYDDVTDPGTPPSPDMSPRTSPMNWSPPSSPAQPSPPPLSPRPSPERRDRVSVSPTLSPEF